MVCLAFRFILSWTARWGNKQAIVKPIDVAKAIY